MICDKFSYTGLSGAPEVGDWAAEVSVPAVGLQPAAPFSAPANEEWSIPQMDDWSAEATSTDAVVDAAANWSTPDENWN